MTDAILRLDAAGGRRDVRLQTYLGAASEERATADAIAWIKTLRLARVDDVSLRERFTIRGDSLWWFAELYLHKQNVVLNLFRTIAALDALFEQERPTAVELVGGGSLVKGLAPQIAAARRVPYRGANTFDGGGAVALAAMDARATALNTTALASRLRRRRAHTPGRKPDAVAFVHRAFWKADAGDGSAEAYIGPVLSALEAEVGRDRVAYVGVGPSSNFRARRWWHPLRPRTTADVESAIESYTTLADLRESRRLWRDRHGLRRALWASADLRARAMIRSCDCWPIVKNELAGVALLQWPWSARAMDEAAAALDALQPRVVVTYAEAGGWGRALMLESRRRGIPTVGLQHGFIYRHWLNYLHEPDEMEGSTADRGFPRPTRTLLFDEYAAQHLRDKGRFPAEALAVTGSPRLDTLAEAVARLGPGDVDATLDRAGGRGRMLVVVAAKHREARDALAALLDGARGLGGVHIAIKTHPAETPAVYDGLVAGRAHVTVLDAATPLAPLLRACRAVVTVNSTVALDAAVLDVPALVLGLPNNLSPFVDAGVMAGVLGADADAAGRALQRILYDEEFRHALARARRAFLTRFNFQADGRAAERAAAAILELAGSTPGRT
jgi:hypothetical protein